MRRKVVGIDAARPSYETDANLRDCNWGWSHWFAKGQEAKRENGRLIFEAIPDLPDELGVAGPIVGYHDVEPGKNILSEFLIVADGVNFGRSDDPKLWELPKIYHDRVWVLQRSVLGKNVS